MPRFCNSAPRKKLPPPTTTATCTPVRTTEAIWRATACTMSGSTPTSPPPKTSPDSLSTTRRGRPGGGAVGSSTAVAVWSPATFIRPTFPRPSRPPTSAYAFAKAVARPAAHHGLRTTVSGSGLADLEPDEPRHIDAGLAEHLLDGLLVVGHRGLLQQDEVLEEGVR